MKRIVSTAAVIAALTAPTLLVAEQAEGRRLGELAFSLLDTAGRGFIDQGEYSTDISQVVWCCVDLIGFRR